MANVSVIYIAAPAERELTKFRYLGFAFLAGLPVYAEGLKYWLFGSEPHVASCGASGFEFGLLGFGLISMWEPTGVCHRGGGSSLRAGLER